MAKNFRSTREFREAILEALGTTQDKDVENEANYKSALLEALGVEHTRSDVVNFETFREKLVEGVTNYSGGSGGGGETWNTVFEGSVTTVDDDGDIVGIIENLTLNGNSIRVTFNGTVYELPKTEHGYGAENESGIDFSTYPLFIATGGGVDSCTLWTLTPGTYSLKIEEPQSGGESDFSTATLTITNTTKNSVIFEVPSYRDGGEVLSTRAIVLGALGDKPARATANVVCKSNGAILTIVTESVTATTSGDIQYIEAEHLYIITGDCAITVSGSQAV